MFDPPSSIKALAIQVLYVIHASYSFTSLLLLSRPHLAFPFRITRPPFKPPRIGTHMVKPALEKLIHHHASRLPCRSHEDEVGGQSTPGGLCETLDVYQVISPLPSAIDPLKVPTSSVCDNIIFSHEKGAMVIIPTSALTRATGSLSLSVLLRYRLASCRFWQIVGRVTGNIILVRLRE